MPRSVVTKRAIMCRWGLWVASPVCVAVELPPLRAVSPIAIRHKCLAGGTMAIKLRSLGQSNSRSRHLSKIPAETILRTLIPFL